MGVRSTYPDLKVTVGQQIAEGDLVVTRATARGTHMGTYSGIPPTNKQTVIEGVNIDRVTGGMIVEHRGAAHTFEALVAIGALPVRCRCFAALIRMSVPDADGPRQSVLHRRKFPCETNVGF